MKTKLTKKIVDALAIGATIADNDVRGFRARRLPSGQVRFSLRYSAAGKERELPLGLHGEVTVEQARKAAADYRTQVTAKQDPAAEREQTKALSSKTVAVVCDKYVAHMRANKRRSADDVAKTFAKHVLPQLGERVVYDLDGEVGERLREIAGTSGIQAARNVHAVLHAAFRLAADFDRKINLSIFPRKRSIGEATKRDRTLDDDELRDLWRGLELLEKNDPETRYGKLIRTVLLTACRISEPAGMTRDEIKGDAWTIPSERYKGRHKHLVTLSPALRAELPASDREHVFASNGFDRPFSGFSKAKALLDAAIKDVRGGKAMKAWRVHDLRRTVRTNLSKLGIPTEVAEAVLGHVKTGIVGVYDHHGFEVEKAAALARWAKHLAGLVHGSPANVRPLPVRRQIGG